MDKDWRNFDVSPGSRAEGEGGGGGGEGSVGPLKDPKFSLYKHSHVAYQIEGYEE